jgi:hypothetical protein
VIVLKPFLASLAPSQPHYRFPAKAGIHAADVAGADRWTPTFVGSSDVGSLGLASREQLWRHFVDAHGTTSVG